MTRKLLTVSICLALASASGYVHAQGNASAGKAKAASCAGCHGEDGNSTMPSFPKLAGQHQGYLAKQLQAFKNGTRNSPMMAPLAAGLDDQAIQEIAAYYASNKISANPAPTLPAGDDDDAPAKTEEQKKAELAALIAQGSDLYRNGNLSREVSACVACHGPYAEGNKPASFPSLHSQHADYLIKTLTDFKTGARSNNRENMMHMIATKMTDEDIKAVSYYISTMK
ncbi:c-type cytochrome [Methylomonas koyamae]|uniref:Cytochrome C n=1 Tax=Methylomonas koyamae TaxID=702114 RepID=A0A291IER8_9GAMM|nr:c-type cytochrome [Methylomonas koyamae]ATG88637.1 cytochrome C [Methylomonas koyamae]OAI27510.1 cytochrome C [Methylomonas koyamae]